MSEAARQTAKENNFGEAEDLCGGRVRGGESDIGTGSAQYSRREPRAQDVQIEILFCGVCHSDLHQVRNE